MAIIEVNFISQCLMRTVTFNAIIPADKFGPQAAAQQKPFKTLYLLHGIQAWAEANDLAVIMPSGENRFYLDDEKSGERYGEFIGRELVEFTRKLFPLSDRREDTFIAGLSMGGYGALRNGLKYAETFGCVAGLSSALIYAGLKDSDNSAPVLPSAASIMRRFSATSSISSAAIRTRRRCSESSGRRTARCRSSTCAAARRIPCLRRTAICATTCSQTART